MKTAKERKFRAGDRVVVLDPRGIDKELKGRTYNYDDRSRHVIDLVGSIRRVVREYWCQWDDEHYCTLSIDGNTICDYGGNVIYFPRRCLIAENKIEEHYEKLKHAPPFEVGDKVSLDNDSVSGRWTSSMVLYGEVPGIDPNKVFFVCGLSFNESREGYWVVSFSSEPLTEPQLVEESALPSNCAKIHRLHAAFLQDGNYNEFVGDVQW